MQHEEEYQYHDVFGPLNYAHSSEVCLDAFFPRDGGKSGPDIELRAHIDPQEA